MFLPSALDANAKFYSRHLGPKVRMGAVKERNTSASFGNRTPIH
jgi:hypothetical protein